MSAVSLTIPLFIGLTCLLVVLLIVCKCVIFGRKRKPIINRLEDKTVLVSDADNAVGIHLVKGLSRRGAKVIMAVRNLELGQDVAMKVKTETNGEVSVFLCDMTSLKSVMDFCAQILEHETRLHILINNPNRFWHPMTKNKDHYELHWVTNHLSNFVMTQMLLPLLHKAGDGARIITVSSCLYQNARINWEDPNFENISFNTRNAYSQSRLANLLFNKELARRLEGTKVNTYCVDPGPNPSDLGLHIFKGLDFAGLLYAFFCYLPTNHCHSAKKASEFILQCATDPDLSDQSGFYYSKGVVVLPNESKVNLNDAQRLWAMSERQVGMSS